MRALLFLDDPTWSNAFQHAKRPSRFSYALAESEDELARLLEAASAGPRARPFDLIVTRRGPRELAFTRLRRLLSRLAPGCPLYLLDEGEVADAVCVGALAPQALVDRLVNDFEVEPDEIAASPFEGFVRVRNLADRTSWSVHAVRAVDSGDQGVLTVFDFSFESPGELEAVLAHEGPHLPRPALLELEAEQARVFYAVGEGLTLREACTALGGVVPPEVGLAILAQLAAALEGLHAAGCRHGWFNPDSVWLGGDGLVSLLHAGVGRSAESFRRDSRGSRRTQRLVTDLWEVPEQVSNTPEADVFRAGLVLFAMLEGHPPFDGPDAFAAGTALREGLVPSMRASALEPLLTRMLARQPEARPSHGAALRAEVLALAPKPGLLARALGRGWNPREVVARALAGVPKSLASPKAES
ncbi:MAG: hypothetical protein Q8L48_27170 [Archangium sp.]|nr:hypothetical protein [Archangium sp.]